jgi:hypothetical protein
MRIIILLFFLMTVGCGSTTYNIDVSASSWVLEKPITYDEEREVLQAVPVEPVYIEEL